MKTCLSVLLTTTLLTVNYNILAQGTAFTYQGRLSAGGSPAIGNYDFTFALFDNSSTNSGQIGGTLTNLDVGVTNALFTVTLDFAANFPGASRWLAIGVRPNGGGSFTALSPLQELTPAPYAITASNLSGTLPAGQLSGTAPSALLSGSYSGALSLNNAGNIFTGDGSNVTNVNAASLAGLNATNFWQTGGNNVATGQFLGSTNNLPLELWVDGSRALRLEPNSQGEPNVIEGASVNYVGAGVVGATIGGGGSPTNAGGNFSNSVTGNFGTVGGGQQNTVSSAYGTVSGGGNNISSGYGATVSGGGINTSSAYGSTVGGGVSNEATNEYATVPGGYFNLAWGNSSFAAGSQAQALHDGAFVWADTLGGGFSSTANNQFNVRAQGGVRFVTGGAGMTLDGQPVLNGTGNGLVLQQNSSGEPNVIEGSSVNYVGAGVVGATIGGGGSPTNVGDNFSNSVTADFGTVGGGQQNTVGGTYGTVSGGGNNISSGYGATVGGGGINTSSAYGSTVGGGVSNEATNEYATVPGGYFNLAWGNSSFAAGSQAQALHDGAFVWADTLGGGFSSTANDQFNVRAQGGVRFVTGGAGMTLDGQPVLNGGNGVSIQQNSSGAPNIIEGSPMNFVPGGVVGATIGGGGATNYSGNTSSNSVTANFGTVGGGYQNTASGIGAFIGGGGFDGVTYLGNNASGGGSVIGGGLGNSSSGYETTVGGGFQNTSSGFQGSTVGGGMGNICSGSDATVPGGLYNEAVGNYSLAAGQQAQALHQGAFVWADSQNATFASSANDQFLIRAQGGVGIGLNNPGFPLDVSGRIQLRQTPGLTAGLWLYQTTPSLHDRSFIGMDGDGYVGLWGNVLGQWGMVMNVTNGNVGIGTQSPDALLTVNGAADKPGGGSWSTFSDARLKKNIRPMTDALDKLLALRGVTFEYIDPEKIHELAGKRIGMIAQEVEKVFPDWVETAATGYKRLTYRGFEALTVEALRELRAEQGARMAELEKANAQMRQELAQQKEASNRMESRVAGLEKALARLTGKPDTTLAVNQNVTETK